MIEITPDRWVHPADLARPVHGRDDSDETIKVCLQHLSERSGQARSSERADRSLRTQSEVLAARIKAWAFRAKYVSAVPESDTIAELRTTVDRLLAYVPTRMRPIAPARLASVAQATADKARGLFGTQAVVPIVVPEEDSDSEASHRLVVSVGVDAFEPERFAANALALHTYLANELSVDEFRALRLVVEPT